MLYNDIRHKYDDDVRQALKYVMARCKIGDWFILFQLNRNVNVYFYRAFIKELRNELRGNPKVRIALEPKISYVCSKTRKS